MASNLPRGLVKDKHGYRIQISSKTLGKRWRKRLPDGTSRAQAERMLSHVRELDFRRELLPPNEPVEMSDEPESERDTISTYADGVWLPHCRDVDSPRTVQIKIYCLVNADPWLGHLALDDITIDDIKEFRRGRKDEGVRDRTVNLEWTTIRTMLQYAYENGARKHPPPQIKKLPEYDSRESRPLSVDEATRALEYAAGRSTMWYALTMTLLHTGARWGDVRGLRWDDVDLNDGVVLYRKVTAKQRRDREVPLVPELIEALQALPREHEYVFARRHRRTKEWITLHQKPKGIGDKYPWEGPDGDCRFGAHTWRHTFASWKLRAGVSIALVSKWLGHKSVQLTIDTYGHIEPLDHRAEIMRGPILGVRRLRVVGDD